MIFEGGRAELLADMALHKHLGLSVPTLPVRRDSGQRVPLQLIASGEDVFSGVNAVCELVLRQFPDGRDFVPAIEWATNEIVDNVIIHAESPVPGCLCAQHYPDRYRLEIAVCDLGRGIKAQKLRVFGGIFCPSLYASAVNK